MPKSDSSLNMLILAAVVALGVGYYVPQTLSSRSTEVKSSDSKPVDVAASEAAKPGAARNTWAASAPGRIEPLGGEIRVGSLVPGRIAEVLATVNEKVAAGDLLVRLDDEDAVARFNAASAEAAARKRERDTTDAGGRLAQDRRSAEDAVANAERQLQHAREEVDRLLHARRPGSDAEFDKARDAVAKSKDRLEQARATQRKALGADGLPPPPRADVALTAARADLSAAEVALERTRIRAPASGTVLLVNAKVGEIVTPSPETWLVATGNLASLRVRAEFEERDLSRLHVGQSAIVRSDAFPGRDFEGKVATLAQALGPSKLGQRGPRKPTDVDVLEALIDLSGQPGLPTGMRVDVFIKPQSADASPPAIPRSTARN